MAFKISRINAMKLRKLKPMKPIKIDDDYLKNMNIDKSNTDWIIEKMCNNLNNQFNDVLVEGLKRKGFEFDNRIEMESFIKKRCRAEDYADVKTKYYYIDDIPFLIHRYESKIITYPKITGNPMKVIGVLGTYNFL